MRNGPEFRPGWRERLKVDGVDVEIHARHNTRNRMPRPHEHARMIGTGRPVTMVEEHTHEWQVLVRGGRQATIRVEPNGTFYCAGGRLHHRTLPDAARAHARREIAVLADAAARRADASSPTGRADEDDVAGLDTPSGP